MTNPLLIIQARMSSTRLPGKILKPFFRGKTILQIQLEIIQKCAPGVEVVVATTTNPADNAIEKFCANLGVNCFRGEEDDVLKRFVDCAEKLDAEKIVRVCSDNPFLNGVYLAQLISISNQLDADYVSYQDAFGTPAIKTHWGLFAEVVKLSALKKASKQSADSFYHEHVTNYIYGNPNVFSVQFLDAPKAVFNRTDLRFTIDTEADFKMAQKLYESTNGQNLDSLINEVEQAAELKTIMKKGIEQFSK